MHCCRGVTSDTSDRKKTRRGNLMLRWALSGRTCITEVCRHHSPCKSAPKAPVKSLQSVKFWCNLIELASHGALGRPPMLLRMLCNRMWRLRYGVVHGNGRQTRHLVLQQLRVAGTTWQEKVDISPSRHARLQKTTSQTVVSLGQTRIPLLEAQRPGAWDQHANKKIRQLPQVVTIHES